ncbi:nucleoside hydrolase [Ketogulonicigenium vulgare]|uniref:Putative inosine-uridine preferring nucleoside hydrolase transmembrane protein n=1 Tax=Ketogulonicigenium vulgare (strain WSH-001) TaxID=759362 RepID=F9Y6A1_KETVW|nr:nucleoside hydrolase [Ketogulonicigenium vulgare]ADO43840.1 pyrimidine-specific ribonucleoside hydrolase RihA [Ketogulonicigenium vulgare Y25]AEM42098.1 putative inosine-uridine preferring nucleoside hydrolase transmembrane protein [Ketogulonicigenium vulgare WSH-001]ALJ79727.1 nucleoside hydrolase [Ketogulonicigenium vulgare]ANW32651.1 nucleoside hydrolase [Ketogulonicigenium vulgare]AOZ55874.1 pyrimidine-specific ribonucleoside hydrolase RihA [Ketogulonicigenium vulgare]
MPNDRRAIIIDTDPSPDDAVTFLMALGSPDEIDLLAITTVGGNVPLHYTTRNALMALELVNRTDVPVYKGAEGPLMVPLETAEHVHGRTGFDGYDLPEPKATAAAGFAPEKIVELVMSRPKGTVTLACLAPLTNIALAMLLEPKLAGHLREIVLMGGARTEGGNITPAAEYNIYADPEAAWRVMNSGVPVVMIPLDCTHKALTTTPRMNALRAYPQPHIEPFYHLLIANKAYNARQDGTDGGPLHDPTVVAYILRPEIFAGRHVNVEIALQAPTRGMTVVDWRSVTGKPANALYLPDIDADAYYALVWERLAAAYRPV